MIPEWLSERYCNNCRREWKNYLKKGVAMKMRQLKNAVLFLIAICLLFNMSGCGSSGGMDEGEGDGGTPAVAVTPEAIFLNTGSASIPADGVSSTTITAVMSGNQGQPVSQGTSVTFTTTLGKFPNGQSSYTVKTPDESGSVATSIIAGTTAGTAQIRGLAGNVSQAATLEFTGDVTAPPASSVSLTATPDKIPSDGVSFSKIEATVKDSSETNVAGASLIFTTTYGTFLSGGQTAAAVTDAEGKASVSLISATTDAIATVVCTSGGVAQVISVIFGEGATNLPVASISLTPNPQDINPDGFSSTVLTAVLADSGGTPVPDGTQVRFTSTLGKFPNGLQEISLNTTDGTAAVALISIAEEEGVAKVTASAGGVSQSASVFIGVTEENAPPSKITISAGSTSLIPNGKITTNTNIDINVTDSKGNAVADGTPITVAIVEGTGSFHDKRIETVITSGTVSGTVKDLTYYVSSTPGTVVIKASTANGLSATTEIFLTEGLIVLTANPIELTANGSSESIITAQLRDADFNILQDDNIQINFSTDSGTFKSNGDRQVTGSTQGGVANVTYVASRTAGAVKISASAMGYGSGETSLTLVAQEIASLSLSTPAPVPADGVSSTTLTATAQDSGGNAVSKGTKITFTITDDITGGKNRAKFADETADGTDTITVETPDDSGSVTVSIISKTKGQDGSGSAQIEVQAGNITQSVTANFFLDEGSLPAAFISLSGPTEVIADGRTFQISATVADSTGATVEGENLTFETTLGEFLPSSPSNTKITSASTSTNGSVNVTLKADQPGIAKITCTAGNVSQQLSVKFIGQPDKVSLTIEPASLIAGSTDTSEITATVTDSAGNPLDGVNVLFGFEGNDDNEDWGKINPFSEPTSGGLATVNYTAPVSKPAKTEGVVTIKAVVDGVDTQVTTIDIIGPDIISIELSSSRSTMPINSAEGLTIRAKPTLAGGSLPPTGTEVIFTVKSGGGSFEKDNRDDKEAKAKTASDGIARVTLYSGSVAETAIITAKSGDAVAEIEIQYTEGSISLNIDRNSILASGGQIVKIEAKLDVESTSDKTIEGQTIEFSVEPTGIGTIEKSPESEKEEPPYKTNPEGIVNVVFVGKDVGGTAVIKGEWKDGNNNVIADDSVEISVLGPPAFILVTEGFPDPTSIKIKGTGGQATSQIIFDVKDSNGEAVADGYRIDFEILTGPDGGEELDPLFDFTSNGQVSTILRSGFKSGPVSVKATYHDNTNVSTSTSQIAIVSGPPVGEEFGLAAAFYNIPGLRTLGLEDSITVDVGDFYGNAVPDNTAISFKTYNTGGEMDPASAATSGIYATSILHSVASPIPSEGFLSVTAEAVNGGRTTHITSLAVIPLTENSQMIYAGTDGGGVYRSADSGSTWQNISRSSTIQGQNWIQPYVNDISVDPDNYDAVYAATGFLGEGHVYRSVDGGLTWNSNNIEEWDGVFSAGVAALSVLCDDNQSDYVWTGTYGAGLWYAEDGEHFVQSQGLGHGKIVQDIVKVDGTNGASAQLYAGTATGVFRSPDGGNTWTQPGRFTGNYITTLELYPKGSSVGNDVIYAGTEGAGVWVSTNSGKNWTNYHGGMGKGLSASAAKADRDNKGSGQITETSVKDSGGEFFKGTPSDTWTLTYAMIPDSGNTGTGSITDTSGKYFDRWTVVVTVTVTTNNGEEKKNYAYKVTGETSGNVVVTEDDTPGYYIVKDGNDTILRFKPEGSFEDGDTFTFPTNSFTISAKESGDKTQELTKTEDGDYLEIPNMLRFKPEGSFANGDIFTFTTTRDPGSNIKDLMVDKKNNLLYAISYFYGEAEAHPVGNVYVHDLGIDGSMPLGDWREANTDLPQFDPPDDTTIFGQHSLALDNPENPSALFIGGEGINFYKATSGLSDGNPTWQPSKNGLSNRIMARKPVLFTGTPGMDITYIRYTGDGFEKNVSFSNADRIAVYIEDGNGNPPYAGCRFEASYECDVIASDGTESTETGDLIGYDYPDSMKHVGTWPDPSDTTTDNPYRFPFPYKDFPGTVCELTFTFAENCTQNVPGCRDTEVKRIVTYWVP